MTRNTILNLMPAMVLALLGLAIAIVGGGYDTGSLTAMGPGFMPVALGIVMVLISLALGVGALRETVELKPTPLRPFLCAAASIVLWAVLADTTGFFPAALGQLLLANFALPHDNWRLLIGKCIGLSIGAYLLFVTVLGLPLPAIGG
jgi:hypothetical protein